MALLEIERLKKNFGGITAINDLSITIQAGQVTAIIGPNGAGKTTLLNVISGVYRPNGGTIVFEGKRIDNVPPHQITKLGISRTFQIVRVFQDMTVLANVMLGGYCHVKAGLWKVLFAFPSAIREEKQVLDYSVEVIGRVGLEKYIAEKLDAMPPGFQRLVELARVMVSEPKLVLLDEPVSGLDVQEIELTRKWIRYLRDNGVGVLLVEHDMKTVMSISDKIIVLNFGQVIAVGTPEEVRNNQQVIEAYLGTRNYT